MTKYLKIITIAIAVIYTIYFFFLISWKLYYDYYLQYPNVEKKLEVKLPQHTVEQKSYTVDEEISDSFGDSGYIRIKIEGENEVQNFTKQVISKGWEKVWYPEIGTEYVIHKDIPDFIADNGGKYYGVWNPEEGTLEYGASVITKIPLILFYYGIASAFIVGVILSILWLILYVYNNFSSRTKGKSLPL